MLLLGAVIDEESSIAPLEDVDEPRNTHTPSFRGSQWVNVPRSLNEATTFCRFHPDPREDDSGSNIS